MKNAFRFLCVMAAAFSMASLQAQTTLQWPPGYIEPNTPNMKYVTPETPQGTGRYKAIMATDPGAKRVCAVLSGKSERPGYAEDAHCALGKWFVHVRREQVPQFSDGDCVAWLSGHRWWSDGTGIGRDDHDGVEQLDPLGDRTETASADG